MPPLAFLLLFGSAVLHTSWNLLLKKAPDKYIASWGTTAIGFFIALPFVMTMGPPPQEVWGLLLASAVVEVLYFGALSYAYRENDFSLVYPIARGAAPALLLVWAVLFLGERFTPGGLLGLGLIIAGLIVIGSAGLRRNQTLKPSRPGVAVSLLTALLISIYTVIDGAAVQQVDPLPYVFTLFMLIPLLITPLVLRRYGWRSLSSSLRADWRKFALMSILGTLAYALALMAYHVAPVGYAGAIREVSVVLAALAGWLLLGEGFGAYRVAGASIVFAGILMIALLG